MVSGWNQSATWAGGWTAHAWTKAVVALIAVFSSAALTTTTGCDTSANMASTGGGGGTIPINTGDSEEEADGITNLNSDLPLSGSQIFTVRYEVAEGSTGVRAFYVPQSDRENVNSRTFFTDSLAGGVGQFNVNTGVIPQGTYLIGLDYTTPAGVQTTVFSTGRLVIQGLPSPDFQNPTGDTQVSIGDRVTILADIGDPDGNANWRMFYIREDLAPDANTLLASEVAELGTELATGTGNVASVDWSTASVADGTYLLGISATDSGFSVSQTADNGDIDQIVTIYSSFFVVVTDDTTPTSQPPVVVVTSPSTNISAFLSQTIQVNFTAQTFEGTLEDVTVFYDTDANFQNSGWVVIESGLSTVNTSVTFNTESLAEGNYRIGVSVNDGVNNVVAAYAAGTLTVVRTPTLTVTSPPSSGIVIRPSQTATISWETNVPASAGTTEVIVVEDLNSDGQPDAGADEIVLTPAEDSTSVSWTPIGLIGRYVAQVRIDFNDATVADQVATSPGFIRVSTAPNIIWTGSLADTSSGSQFQGVIFEGVQPEDNLGSSIAPVGDMDADGAADFVLAARYGKPFFANTAGIGHGEGYLVYGSRDRIRGRFNMNSLGTSTLRGVTFAGIRTPQGNTETDGLSCVASIPDVDGDGFRELIFGFPRAESRGHNVHPQQDGVINPRALATLERENQFMRGGIVIVSSMNSALRNPSAPGVEDVINLDMVGQDFEDTCVLPEPDIDVDDLENAGFFLNDDALDSYQVGAFVQDVYSFDEDAFTCEGNCADPMTDDFSDANGALDFGFAPALARDYLSTYVYGPSLFGGLLQCGDEQGEMVLEGINSCSVVFASFGNYCKAFPNACEPFSPGLHVGGFPFEQEEFGGFVGGGLTYAIPPRRSGYYPTFIPGNSGAGTVCVGNDDDLFCRNGAIEPLGARIIGVGIDDKFGTSLTLSNAAGTGAGSLIVSAPERTARGILLGVQPDGCDSPPECGGEIDGLESSPGTPKSNQDSGVAYMFRLRGLWTDEVIGGSRRIPPKPHQYIVGEPSHCSGVFPTIDAIDAVRIAGDSSEKISNIQGIPDFNGDGREDFAVGAPEAAGGSGRVYIGFRRDPSIEGDYVLEKLELTVNDTERLSGALIIGNAGSDFAFSLASDVDLNSDGESDLIVGAPGANDGTGEIIIIFSSPSLITPQGGTAVDQLVADGRAAKITGAVAGDLFGFNVASGGDIDGDGFNDLLVAAPGATPMFDSTPNDGVDILDTPGLDLDADGLLDNITGPNGVPEEEGEGNIDELDELIGAGVVYIIWGSNVVSGEESIAGLGTTGIEGAIVVGRRGADDSAGRRGDALGGGDAGDAANFGGVTAKRDRGRSFGLAAAGDVDGDGFDDFLIGSILATPRIDPVTGEGITHGGEAYLIYGFGR